LPRHSPDEFSLDQPTQADSAGMALWRRTRQWKQARIAQLRARDGSACWLCFRDLFTGGKLKNRKATIEHLTPRALGGGDALDNLVLCHPGCNQHLGCRPVDKKLKMREKWRRAIGA
jgi:5-methylcytosine-specific restriction endonuclease McrA